MEQRYSGYWISQNTFFEFNWIYPSSIYLAMNEFYGASIISPHFQTINLGACKEMYYDE